jgi:hypothetical protein
VITGFNTDIEHGGTVYHVQTEDKGLDTPFILSLVYVGGAILASKRAPYDDLLRADFDQSALAERLQRQHKLICAAINAGRIDDLKRMSRREAPQQPADEPETQAGDPKSRAREEEEEIPPALTGAARPIDLTTGARTLTTGSRAPRPVAAESPVVAPSPSDSADTPSAEAKDVVNASEVAGAPVRIAAPSAEREFVAGDVKKDRPVEEEAAAPAAAAPSEAARERSAKRAVKPKGSLVAAAADVARALHERMESPAAEAVPVEIDDALHIELLDDRDFHAGEIVTLRAAVLRGPFGDRVAVRDANVTVKVLGTEFRPLILTAQTDQDGVAIVHAWLPRFTKGRAAILVRAAADGCTAELRRIIHHN